jgi:soluble lytic murein transglycosylase-like protein
VTRWIWILVAWGVLWAQEPARDPMQTSVEKQRAAMAQQRQSVRRQVENLGVWLPPAADSPPATPAASPTADSGCDAMADTAVAPLVEEAAKAQSLEPRLLRAVIEQESAFRPCAVSPKGAKGLMQLMPETASDMGIKDPFDPRESLAGGAKYLKLLLDKYKGNLSQALGAYNAGPATVDSAGGVPDIPETKDYVKAILERLGR